MGGMGDGDRMIEESVVQLLSPLAFITTLCQALETEQITYCHWKSNNALMRSASGENDLDLLIGRADAQRFTALLYRLGAKRTTTPIATQMPGVIDYYGYDAPTDKFVHVHAHYQLIVGHDRTKNYHLPLAQPFLASARPEQGFKVPSPEFEFIVFVIRMVLKYGTWDVILGGQGTLPTAARREFEYLQGRVDGVQLSQDLVQHVPYLEPALFAACVQSLHPDCSLWARMNVGYQLQQVLQPYARRTPVLDVGLKLWRRGVRALQRRQGRLPQKRLADGGAMIALVGGDGAGKSTAVAALTTWLASNFETTPIHLGKPPWSATTTLVRGGLKLGRLMTPWRQQAPPY